MMKFLLNIIYSHLVLVGNKTNLIKFSVIWKSIINDHCQSK